MIYMYYIDKIQIIFKVCLAIIEIYINVCSIYNKFNKIK